MSLIVAVEGSTDAPAIRKVVALAGWDSDVEPILGHGKDGLDKHLPGYNAAAKGSPWLVLRDLDHDAACPGALVDALLPARNPLMCLRIAVRAIEAWFMADPDTLAAFLHVSSTLVPSNPEAEGDPKLAMVNLARRSPKPLIHKDMLPARGASRRTGPGYEGRIIEYGQEHWRPEIARSKSPSLDRAIRALESLHRAWTVVHPIMER